MELWVGRSNRSRRYSRNVDVEKERKKKLQQAILGGFFKIQIQPRLELKTNQTPETELALPVHAMNESQLAAAPMVCHLSKASELTLAST